MSGASDTYADLFADHGRYLWGLCYRMTGSAADADDLVQDTFARAIERPPADTRRPWRPWLVRVAMNLSRDALRRRRSREYVGPWLPSPVETDERAPPSYEPTVDGRVTTAGRYELMESVSFAFLLALEALSEQQRAVLLLRDVFDYSVAETAEALELSAANVKTTLHRARAAMAAYDARRAPPSSELSDRTRDALGRLLVALASRDHDAVAAVLDEQIVAYSDGGGQFVAARVPVVGRDKVARFYLGVTRTQGAQLAIEVRMLNGGPAFVLEAPPEATLPEGMARRLAILCDVGPDGRIVALHSVLATAKLTALRPPAGPPVHPIDAS